MYSQAEDGRVRITLEPEQYNLLLITLGYAMATATNRGDGDLAVAIIKLANSINYGNPNWTPYEEKLA